MRKKLIAIFVLAVVVGLATYFVLNTPLGVHIVLDVIGGGGAPPDYDSDTGPLTLTATLTPLNEIILPKEVEQPSGIQHRGEEVYISTDQAELFLLDNQFHHLREKVDLLGGPLLFKQGSLEAIEYSQNTLFAIGEFGAIRTWEKRDRTWDRAEDLALPASIAGMEFSGITQFDDRRLATSEDLPVIIDLKNGTTHELNGGSHIKGDADLSKLQFSGLAQENGNLYILTETHSSILVVDSNDYSVKAVYGISPGPVADLAVRNGLAYVVVDHNYSEKKPPVYVYDLRSLDDNAKIAKPNSNGD